MRDVDGDCPAERRSGESLLRVIGLTVVYPGGRRRQPLTAVDDVSFEIARGETVGLVGESGSGKTSIGRALLGLTRVHRGTIEFEGVDITRASSRTRRGISEKLQVVFQNPYSSLNPSKRIGQTLAEPLLVHRGWERDRVERRVRTVLEQVGLPRSVLDRYPRQFSGGQRQRIAIARALTMSPRLVVCDEPVSSLDLSVQAQILNLLADLQQELSLSYLFISHDLAVVRYLSDRIVVLRDGKVIESGAAEDIYENPSHPYTRRLLDAIPVPDPEQQRGRSIRVTARETGSPEPLPVAHVAT